MYSIRFGYTGSANVMAESAEKACELLEGYNYDRQHKLTPDDLLEFDENEVDANYGDE